HAAEKPYECPACGKGFTRSSNRDAHQRTHGGARPHQCSQCGKSFGRRSELAKHRRLHGTERPGAERGKSF
ncbi:ZN551 protein, partial [Podargus strigoides]|nr:ZN551 protein [Podargus strigoides]